MNLICLMRFTFRMSAFVALLVGTVSVSAMASPSIYLVPVGESRVYRLARPITRVAVGNPEVADYIIINPSELYLLGKKTGATNLVVWDQKGNFTSTPLQVSRNIHPIEVMLKVVLPNETDIQIFAWGPALVLAGTVSNTLVAESAYRLVKSYMGGTVPEVNPETTLANSASASGSAAHRLWQSRPSWRCGLRMPASHSNSSRAVRCWRCSRCGTPAGVHRTKNENPCF